MDLPTLYRFYTLVRRFELVFGEKITSQYLFSWDIDSDVDITRKDAFMVSTPTEL